MIRTETDLVNILRHLYDRYVRSGLPAREIKERITYKVEHILRDSLPFHIALRIDVQPGFTAWKVIQHPWGELQILFYKENHMDRVRYRDTEILPYYNPRMNQRFFEEGLDSEYAYRSCPGKSEHLSWDDME